MCAYISKLLCISRGNNKGDIHDYINTQCIIYVRFIQKKHIHG